jgi:hypothetical protein
MHVDSRSQAWLPPLNFGQRPFSHSTQSQRLRETGRKSLACSDWRIDDRREDLDRDLLVRLTTR